MLSSGFLREGIQLLGQILMAALGFSLPMVMNIEGNNRQAGKPAQEQVETAGSEVLPS